MAAGYWKKLSVLTILVTIITILYYKNLSQRSDRYYLREVGPSKMSDKELYSNLPMDTGTTTEAGSIDISHHKRRKITSSVNSNQINILSYSTRRLKETKDESEATVGYVLADDYWEQQNSGCRNLQSLQCWAAKLNMKVVEPFIVNSVPRTLPTSANTDWLRHSRMFDMDQWNKESVKLNHSELVHWEDFLAKAHRNVITVEFEYAYSKDVQRKQRELKTNPTQEIEFECEPHKGWPKATQVAFLKSHNFTIVRKVCLNFEHGKFLTQNEFRNTIIGEYSPDEVTIIFKQWRGLGIVGRILVKATGCVNTGIQENMQPNHRVFDDARKYASMYLTGNLSKPYTLPTLSSLDPNVPSQEYIAVMARLEKSKLSFNKRPGIVPYCFEQTLKYTRKLVEDSGIGRTFLSIDIGKFGSNSFKNTGDSSDLHKEFEKFFKSLYGGRITIKEWERTFQDVTHTDDSGYIALLQKVIVTQAKCVIFVGGGAFQKHALNLYQSLHPKREWCIHVVNECTTDKNLPMD